MKLTAHEKIAAPRDVVWEKLTDFARFEAMAADHATVVRTEDGDLPTWTAHVDWRGMNRDVELSVAERAGPESLSLKGSGSGIAADIKAVLIEIDATTTALDLEVDLKGKSLAGKAMVQGLKLARGSIQEKFEGRIRSLARAMANTAV